MANMTKKVLKEVPKVAEAEGNVSSLSMWSAGESVRSSIMKITNVSAYILVRSRFFLAALIAGLGLMWAGRGNAQTLAPVYSFSASPASTNSDGANPYAGLVLSGSTVYGVAQYGGTNGDGVVFAVNLDGSGFTNLYNFTGGNDGAHPQGGLILAGGTL